jgi:hypothetical protein
MVYKIFPEKSATLYSYYPTLNSGLDEILELSTYLSIGGTYEVSRPIIKFPQDEIADIITNKVGTNSYSASLNLSLAYSTQLPLNYSIYCYPLAVDWNVGTGRLANSPITTDGVSWGFTTEISGSTWFDTIIPGTTSSYNTNVGGGLWYTGSSYETTQSFTRISDKDITLNVTDIVDSWFSSSIDNNGFILKHSNTLEFSTSSVFETKYFSGNTHTIYPPYLEIKWDDSYYSSSLSQPSSANIVVSLGNNQSIYQQDAIQRFRINVRDQFPARTFQTSSVYLNNKILPSSSYWSIKDLDTDEVVVDFFLTEIYLLLPITR